MIKILTAVIVCTTAAGLAFTPQSSAGDEKEKPKPTATAPLVVDGKLKELAWLAGEWRGKAGDTEVVTWHSDPTGGMIVMATKEIEGGKVSLFDFGVVSERAEAIAFVPYPFGKPSVPFLLEGHDPQSKRARFVNAKHDFPQSFTFERTAANELTIALDGEEGGQARHIDYKLTLATSKQ